MLHSPNYPKGWISSILVNMQNSELTRGATLSELLPMPSPLRRAVLLPCMMNVTLVTSHSQPPLGDNSTLTGVTNMTVHKAPRRGIFERTPRNIVTFHQNPFILKLNLTPLVSILDPLGNSSQYNPCSSSFHDRHVPLHFNANSLILGFATMPVTVEISHQ